MNDAGLLCDVLKAVISEILEQAVGSVVGREEYIGQSVVVEIAHRNAAAVVKIEVVQDVKFRGANYLICEIQVGLLRIEPLKAEISGLFS